MLDRALSFRHAGPYQLQAAIAAVHAGAEDARKTDWPRIAALIAMAEGTERGLALVDALGGSLDGYHLFHSARADLLRRLGRDEESAAAYARALELAPEGADRRFLERRLVTPPPGRPTPSR